LNKLFFTLLLLTLAAYGQQERVAIINTVDDRDSIGVSELIYLTDRLRETAVNVLPKPRYGVMTTESIVAFLGSQERAEKECRESSCLAELGRKVSADYVSQARIGRFEGDLTIKVELYSSKSGVMIGSFTGESKYLQGLRTIIDEKAPILFKKLPDASGGIAVPFIAGGIGGVQTADGDYEFEGTKRYLVSITSNPEGASLSFNGIPDAHCTKTPCNVELREGNARIIANLEQYEIADTTVSIKQNKQNINIRLKANFGVLEIKPAYLGGIGNSIPWNLSINDKHYSLGEIRLSPKEYIVKLNHECYEDISFKAGINKDRREIFDMANNIVLKKGGLDLSAEADDEPVSEPVYVNGKRVGETPFSGSVPICAKIQIGAGRETVNVNIKHKATKTYTHKMDTEELRRRQEERRQAELEAEMLEEQRQIAAERAEAMRTAWATGIILFLGGGVSLNMNEIDHDYFKSMGGQWNVLNFEFYKRNIKFFRFGFNWDIGEIGVERDRVRKMQPNVTDSISSYYLKLHAFARLYPVDFLFLSGGVGWNRFLIKAKGTKPGSTEQEDVSVMNFSNFVFPVGGGICLCTSDGSNFIGRFNGFVIEGLYNIVPFREQTAKYITINIGIRVDWK